MRIACLDCFSGISGDMLLGAVIDAGAPARSIKHGLDALGLPAWRLQVSRVKRGGFKGAKVEISARRPLREKIRAIIERARRSRLPAEVKASAEKAIRKLLAAEGRVHGVRARAVHLHEIENLDTIVDVYGSVLGLSLLGVERMFSTAVNVGSGSIRTSHGILPVPAPGTAELLRGREMLLGRRRGELATPTGAALLSALCSAGPPPAFVLDGIGYGAGSREDMDGPNMLRIMLGNAEGAAGTESICQLECVVDDMSPQLVEAFMERVYRAGAREAWTTAVNMKKQRPGMGLYALVDEENLPGIMQAFFEETGTLGIRITRPQRVCLPRRMTQVSTKWGRVRVKLAGRGAAFHAIPEYEDIKALARRAGLPVRLVMERVRARLARGRGG